MCVLMCNPATEEKIVFSECLSTLNNFKGTVTFEVWLWNLGTLLHNLSCV